MQAPLRRVRDARVGTGARRRGPSRRSGGALPRRPRRKPSEVAPGARARPRPTREPRRRAIHTGRPTSLPTTRPPTAGDVRLSLAASPQGIAAVFGAGEGFRNRPSQEAVFHARQRFFCWFREPGPRRGTTGNHAGGVVARPVKELGEGCGRDDKSGAHGGARPSEHRSPPSARQRKPADKVKRNRPRTTNGTGEV
jgi:hypothetical protein